MDRNLCQAWCDAGLDLGVEVIAPYEETLADGTVVRCEAFLPHFGSPKGALVLSDKTARQFEKRLKDEGLWYSILMAGYQKYVRKDFVDVMRDWDWFGSADQKPDWL